MRVRIVLVLLLCFGAVSAQERLNTFNVDQESLDLYLQEKWPEIIDISAKAHDQGIEFFYLQARTGIAYYNLKKYRKASEYLLKVWEKDQSFDWLQRYLYYSLILSGRSAEAQAEASGFTHDFKKEIGYAEKKIKRIALEGGYSFNDDYDKFLTHDFNSETALSGDYGETFLFKNYHFESMDLSHDIKPGITLNHNLTFIGGNREQMVDWETSMTFPNDYYQFQYYLNPHFLLADKFHISPSVSLIWGQLSYQMAENDSYNSITDNYSDFVFSTSAWAHFGNFSPGAELALANIYDEGFTQFSAWLTYYPFSNTNFYITPRVYFKSTNDNTLSYNTFGILAGAQIGKFHITGHYLNGDMENFIEYGGYVVSNFPGKSSHKFTGSLFVPLCKNKQLVFRYINQNITETYLNYFDERLLESIDYSFNKQTLTIGLSWIF